MYPEGRLWGFNPSVESSICFSIVYAQKYCPVHCKLCSCIYEIQKFCTGKRKNVYSIFTFCFSLLALPLDPVWGLLLSRRPSSAHFRQFLIYLLWNPSTVKSWVRLWCNHPNLYPLKALGCGSPDTGVMWAYCEVTLFVMLFAKKCHEFLIKMASLPSKLLSK